MRIARRLLAVPAALLTVALLAVPAAGHDVEGAITHRDTRQELALADVAATAGAANAPAALPYIWCGDERTTDDALQANVALVQRFLASQSGGGKALRIDMGTRCGPQFVDLQVVHLSGPRS